MKKLFLIIGVIIALTTCFYAFTAEYSMGEITADNFEEKLKEKRGSLLLNNVIPDNFIPAYALEYEESDNFNNNGLKISKEDHSNGVIVVTVISYTNDLTYLLYFYDKTLYSLDILKRQPPASPFLKEMITKLSANNEFSLKQTLFKKGKDIIIKETNDSYIIGSFSNYDNQGLYNVNLKCYSKKKYIRF